MDLQVHSVQSVSESFANCLLLHEQNKPDHEALRFYPDHDTPPVSLTYNGLLVGACSIAANIAEVAQENDRVLIMHSDGPEFLKSFFGCLFAGTIPVPVFPPRDKRTFERFMVIANDATARVLLLPSQFEGLLRGQASSLNLALPAFIIATDRISEETLPLSEVRKSAGRDIAFLQYTSGSTAAPKAVMVTNDALIANIRMIHHAMSFISEGVMGLWLPMQHDMGLIGGLLSSVYAGHTCILTTPTSFMRSPLNWLSQVSRHRVTHTALPNFAFDLCVSKTSHEEREALDLSQLRFVWNAAEPVREKTMQRFVQAFAASRFDATALYPSFGLAEATLTSTGMRSMRGVKACHFVATEIDAGRASPSTAGPDARSYVSCGEAHPGSHLRIVSPETGLVCDANVVGEIWLAGPHIAAGYWNNPTATRSSFQNTLPGEQGQWLRTGDLGFLHEGEVYITGRLKDLIIVRGRNLFPSDIEGALEGVHRAMRPGCCAVFGIEHEGEESIAVAAEIRKDSPSAHYAEIVRSIRKTVAESFQTTALVIALLPQGGSLKTSSGKLQRTAMRKALESGSLETLYIEDMRTASLPGSEERSESTAEAALRQDVEGAWMAQWLSKRLRVAGVLPDVELSEYGIDSLVVAELTAAIEERTGIRLLVDAPWTYPTIRALSAHLCSHGPAQTADQRSVTPSMNGTLNQSGGPGPMDGSLADFRDLAGGDVLDRTRPFLAWRRARIRTGLWPYGRTLQGTASSVIKTKLEDGANAEGINLGSIDYLGLSSREDIKEAAIRAIRDYGPHSASAPMFSGASELTRELEEVIGEHLNYPEVVLFPTGWMAGWGSIAGLVRPNDHVVMDLLAHNCLQQGARAATQRIRHFGHLDNAHAENLLREIRALDTQNGILVVSEGLFSMDSDWPDLRELQSICSTYDARLLVDISHDLASMGPRGTGQLGIQKLLGKVDIVMGGFSKGLAANGGFVACHSSSAREYLRVYADSNLFATALSPPSAAVALEAIRIARSDEGEHLRMNLAAVSQRLREELGVRGIKCHGSASPLIPVHVGTEGKARVACSRAMQDGVITNLVEFPAVPVGMARLRLQLMASHSIEQANEAARVIADAIRGAEF